MSYAKMAQELRKATKNVDASDRFMQALEERDLQQKAEYDRIIAQMRQDNAQMRQDNAQMRQDNARFIEQHRADNAKFIDIGERELQLQNKQLELQNKQLRFLSWAIPAATGILALLIIIFGVIT